MIWQALLLNGVFRLELERHEDERGFFARSWCTDEAAAHEIDVSWQQCNISFNRDRGTVRGLHYSVAPRAEAKLVRCTRGSIFDVVVDLRRDSPTFGQWCAAELSAENRTAVFVPVGCAHGFQTLEHESEVFYQMGDWYDPAVQRGLRWDDPAVGIVWPLAATSLSDRDATHPSLADMPEEPL